MSDTIQFLETMGRGLTAVNDDGFAAAGAALDIGDGEREALLRRDVAALEGLLGGKAAMMSQQWAPKRRPDEKPDDHEDAPGEPDQDDTDAPGQDKPKSE